MIAAEAWNNFLDKLIEAKVLWEKYQEVRITEGITEGLDVPSQRHMASTLHRAKFDIALPRLVAYWRRYGGIEGIFARDLTGSKFDTGTREKKGKEEK